MFELFQSINFDGKLVFEGRITLFIPKVNDLDGYFLLGKFINAFENVALFGEVQVIIEPIRIVLYFFPQLVSVLAIHNNKVIKSKGVSDDPV